MSDDRKINRQLNDELRVHLLGGGVLLSPKVSAFNLPTLHRLIERLARYDSFSGATDPSGEHACGTFDFEGAIVIFKIDVEPCKPAAGSPSSEPAAADRLMTVMLAEEYVLLNCSQSRPIARTAR